MTERARPPAAPRGTTARAAAAVARWTGLPPDAARLLLMAALVRVALICWGEVQDRLSPDVKYTDTDYGVFTDAARSIWRGDGDGGAGGGGAGGGEGGVGGAGGGGAGGGRLMRGTPFARATYRYSPLLAFAVLPNLLVGVFGKVLFSAADLVAGVQCYRLAEAAMGNGRAAGGAGGAAAPPSSSSSPSSPCRALVLSAAAGWWAAAAWLFNPFTATVSTRGSCDSLAVVMLLGLLQLLLALGPPPPPPARAGRAAATAAAAGPAAFLADVLRDLPGSFRAVAPAALLYGLAVHFRIYPIIYAPSTVLFLARRRARAAEEEDREAREAAAVAAAAAAAGSGGATPLRQRRGGRGEPTADPPRIVPTPPCRFPGSSAGGGARGGGARGPPPFFLSRPFLRGLLTDGAAFGVVSAAAFAALGLAFYGLYGREFLHEAFLHHLGRLDPRHNFSAYFYPIYLRHFGGLGKAGPGIALSAAAAAGGGAAVAAGAGAAVDPARWAGLPQVAVLLAVALALHAHLPLAWLLSTVAFVALNKVSTAQYFVWYFCLLPPALPHLLRWRGGGEGEGGGNDDGGGEGGRGGFGAGGGGSRAAGGRVGATTGRLAGREAAGGGADGGSSSGKRNGADVAAAALAPVLPPPRPSVPRPLQLAAAAWALLQLHWLAWGYAVEFAGRGAFLGLWAASVAFLAANAGLAAALVLCYRRPRRSFLALSLEVRRRRRPSGR